MKIFGWWSLAHRDTTTRHRCEYAIPHIPTHYTHYSPFSFLPPQIKPFYQGGHSFKHPLPQSYGSYCVVILHPTNFLHTSSRQRKKILKYQQLSFVYPLIYIWPRRTYAYSFNLCKNHFNPWDATWVPILGEARRQKRDVAIAHIYDPEAHHRIYTNHGRSLWLN